MRHFCRRCRPTPGICLAIFTVVLTLTGFALPRAQAAPQAPLADPNPPLWIIA